MGKHVVFDKKGIIHESDDWEEARREYYATKEFDGDLYICEVYAVRR